MDKLIKATASTKIYDPERRPLSDLGVVRAYGESPGGLGLQIRSAGSTTNRGRKTWHSISHARLDLDSARALYAALGEWIGEQGTAP
jgi:hypothetical protein